MTSKKIYFGLLGMIGLLFVGGVAAITIGNSMLKEKSNKLVELKLENRVLEEQQVALLKANKDIEKYAELEEITKSIVPQDKDQARTVRELIKIADDNGIGISSITFPNSTLGTAQPKAQKTEGEGTASTTPAAPPISQVKPVEGMKDVYQLEITLQSDTSQAISYNNYKLPAGA